MKVRINKNNNDAKSNDNVKDKKDKKTKKLYNKGFSRKPKLSELKKTISAIIEKDMQTLSEKMEKREILGYMTTDAYLNRFYPIEARDYIKLEVANRVNAEIQIMIQEVIDKGVESGASEEDILKRLNNEDALKKFIKGEISEYFSKRISKCISNFVEDKMEELSEKSEEATNLAENEQIIEPKTESKKAKAEKKANKVREKDVSAKTEIKQKVKEKTSVIPKKKIVEKNIFVEEVREFTDGFRFLAQDALIYIAITGNRKSGIFDKFSSTENKLKFLELQDKVLNIRNSLKTTEYRAIQLLLETDKTLDKDEYQVLNERLKVLSNLKENSSYSNNEIQSR